MRASEPGTDVEQGNTKGPAVKAVVSGEIISGCCKQTSGRYRQTLYRKRVPGSEFLGAEMNEWMKLVLSERLAAETGRM